MFDNFHIARINFGNNFHNIFQSSNHMFLDVSDRKSLSYRSFMIGEIIENHAGIVSLVYQLVDPLFNELLS